LSKDTDQFVSGLMREAKIWLLATLFQRWLVRLANVQMRVTEKLKMCGGEK
jgi:hypothetical protein